MSLQILRRMFLASVPVPLVISAASTSGTASINQNVWTDARVERPYCSCAFNGAGGGFGGFGIVRTGSDSAVAFRTVTWP